jgi:tRNA pseudouridine55 synthase
MFRPGLITDTWDLEGYKISEEDCSSLKINDIKKVAHSMEGTFLQTPPVFSAKKINGKPAYYYARRNPYDDKINEMKKNLIQIYDMEVLSFNGTEAELTIHCSSGTYIRSVIFQMGMNLGCGATMTYLERTAIGSFKLKDCIDADEIDRIALPGMITEYKNSIIDIETAKKIIGTGSQNLQTI